MTKPIYLKKIRPYRGKYKIPTHKHTPKRYQQSNWLIKLYGNENITGLYETNAYYPLVTDLTKKPKVYRVSGFNSGKQNKSEDIITLKPLDEFFNYLSSDFRKSGFEPIKPHKLGIFENLINRIRRK